MSRKIYLVDGNSFIYRMFFALPEFSTSGGKVVNALFGMAKFFTGQLIKESPDYLVFVKDAKGDNFRHDLYSDYKATRDRMPDALRSQISDIETMIGKMQVDIIEIPGYEADDVIATLAIELGKDPENDIYILSGDKDLYALTTQNVQIYDTQKKKISGPEETKEKFGVPAECVRDYLAICGDASDNIPGIAGIGPKKAVVLLNEFGSLENIYSTIDSIEESYDTLSPESQKILKGKTLEKFQEGRENAFLSQKLATLETNVEMKEFLLEEYIFNPENITSQNVMDFFQENEFYSLTGKEPIIEYTTWKDTGLRSQIVGDDRGISELGAILHRYDKLFLDTETTSLNVQEAHLVGISLYLDEKNIYYINIGHRGPQVSQQRVRIFLEGIFSSDLTIVGHNLKYDLEILTQFLEKDSQNTQPISAENDGQMELGL